MKVLSLVVLASLFLAGCNFFGKSEADSFTEATIKATCLIFQSDTLFNQKLDDDAKAIFKQYGFPVDDTEKMKEISAKYTNDEKVNAAIDAGVRQTCGDKLPAGFGNPPTTPATPDTSNVPATTTTK